ncbi:nuclease [Candidatus Poribacteria bacterium]|nr:MAG: nuclease [Candidatus Poribacteria bacterium]
MRKTVLSISLGLLFLCAIFYPQANDIAYPVEDFSKNPAYLVLRVVDGDTVEIDYQGKKMDVRLIGVDTPETVHPSKPVESYGKEASAFLKNLLLGESVYLRFDRDKTDKYGRLLAYLYRAPDGLFVNLEIVRQGYGHAYTKFPFKHSKIFQHYAAKARESGKGLYGVVQPPNEPEPPEAVQDVQVYRTKTGKKYHRAGCRWLKSKIPITLEEAKLRYGPCRVCNPPR